MYYRVVIAVGNHADYLFKLHHTVRCHNAGKVIQIVREPAQKAEKETDKSYMFFPKVKRLICGKQKGMQYRNITAVGK